MLSTTSNLKNVFYTFNCSNFNAKKCINLIINIKCENNINKSSKNGGGAVTLSQLIQEHFL